MGITLHEVSGEYLFLLQQASDYAEEHEGLIPDDLSDKIDTLTGVRSVKIKNCAHAFKNLTAEAEAIKNEAKTLAARAKAVQGQADWLEKYIRYNIKEGELFSAPTYAIKWRKSSAIEITNLEKVPLSLCKEVEKVPKLKEIKQAIIDGEDTSEYAIVISRTNMQIS